MTEQTITEKQAEILEVVEHLYATKPDWATFYRETLGARGIVRHTFRTRQELAEFKESMAYREIQRMLTELRGRGAQKIDEHEEPTRVITVRIPRCLHESLFTEAHEYRTSINKLCISKLMQFIENELVPQERETIETLPE